MSNSIIDLLMPMGNVRLLDKRGLGRLLQIDKSLNSVSALVLGFEAKVS